MTRIWWLTIATGLALIASASAAAPAAPKVDKARIDALFTEQIAADSPGCAVAVVEAGEVLYAQGYGLARVEGRLPITPDTVFDIASTSKQFTAALILMLAGEGKLALGDDIRDHLPELRRRRPPIEIRHLLHHTSGLHDYIGLLEQEYDEHTTGADALAAIAARERLDFRAGSEYRYSNSGYFLLGQIAERVSGKKLKDLAQSMIFGPLGMKDTQIVDDHRRKIARKAASYEQDDDGEYALTTSAWEQTGDGAVHTTVLDLAQWDANFYRPKVGGPELVAAMLEPGTLEDGDAIEYAGGLVIGEHRGKKTVRHDGSWLGYRAELVRFPDQRFSVITLCNGDALDASELAFAVADVLLDQRL